MDNNNQNLSQPPAQNIPAQEPLATPPPPVNPAKPKSKLLVLAAVIVLFVVGATSAALMLLPKAQTSQTEQAQVSVTPQPTATPTSSQTIPTDWKTFENEAYSISFPSNFTHDPEPTVTFFELHSPDYADDSGLPLITDGYKIALSVNEGCEETEQPGDSVNQIKSTKIEDTTWLGKKASLYKAEIGTMNSYSLVNDEVTDTCILITFPVKNGTDNYSSVSPLFFQIANTVKLKQYQ